MQRCRVLRTWNEYQLDCWRVKCKTRSVKWEEERNSEEGRRKSGEPASVADLLHVGVNDRDHLLPGALWQRHDVAHAVTHLQTRHTVTLCLPAQCLCSSPLTPPGWRTGHPDRVAARFIRLRSTNFDTFFLKSASLNKKLKNQSKCVFVNK